MKLADVCLSPRLNIRGCHCQQLSLRRMLAGANIHKVAFASQFNIIQMLKIVIFTHRSEQKIKMGEKQKWKRKPTQLLT